MDKIYTTTEELTTIVKEVVESVLDRHMRIMYANIRRAKPKSSGIGFLVGLPAISGFLHCSIPTAKKRLDTVLKSAVLSGYDGKTYLLDGDRALELLQKNAERHRLALKHPKNKKHV